MQRQIYRPAGWQGDDAATYMVSPGRFGPFGLLVTYSTAISPIWPRFTIRICHLTFRSLSNKRYFLKFALFCTFRFVTVKQIVDNQEFNVCVMLRTLSDYLININECVWLVLICRSTSSEP